MVDGQAVSYWPVDLNEAGIIIGFNDKGNVIFIQQGTQTQSIDSAFPSAINNRIRTVLNINGTTTDVSCPQLLGYYGTESTLWQRNLDGTSYLRFKLEDMIPEMAGWELHDLLDLNDSGMIVGSGTYTGPKAEAETHGFLLLPIEFELVHTETDHAGYVLHPGVDVALRDEIVDLRIKIPPLENQDWAVDLTIEPEEMRTQALPVRGDAQVYDFGNIASGGQVQADQSHFVVEAANQGKKTIKAVFNKEGTLKVRMQSSDGKFSFLSQQLTIPKRTRKYGRDTATTTFDFNQHDLAFENAANHWAGVYQHAIDDVERLKAIGMAESELGRLPTSTSRPDDIMTIGSPGTHVLDILHAVPSHQEYEVDIPNNTIRTLNYPDANHTPAATAILYGTCWLYHKAQTIQPDLTPGPWHSWDYATTQYNGGGVSNYLERVTRAFQQGRHLTDDTATIWPLKTDKRAR